MTKTLKNKKGIISMNKGKRKQRVTKAYLAITNMPKEQDIYDIFKINVQTAFAKGFKINNSHKYDSVKIIKKCREIQKISKIMAKSDTDVEGFINMLWDIIIDPEKEIVYRYLGIDGIFEMGIDVRKRLIKKVKKYLEKDEKTD